MQEYIIILVLLFLFFIFFCIYFIFKQMQFVIQAINLYKDMVLRQDAMLKILKDIRDITSGKEIQFYEDVKVTSSQESNKLTDEKIKDEFQQRMNAQKSYDNGYCPDCGIEIDKTKERCLECDLVLTEYMQ